MLQRRLLSILLLFCIFGAPVGLYCYWWRNLQRVKKEVKISFLKGLPNTALVTLRINKKDAAAVLHWEHKGEFEYQGQLYDVVDSLQRNDTLFYSCWWDKKETHIKRRLKALMANILEQDLPQRENQKRLYVFFKSLFCGPPPSVAWTLRAPRFEMQRPVVQQGYSLSTFKSAPPAPPPKYV